MATPAVTRAVEYVETESTLEVDDGTAMPPLVGGPVASVGEPVTRLLEATYYDTEGLALAAARTTLRLRRGGDDDGWHLKLPVGPEQRLEVRLPVGRSTRTPPVQLRRRVVVHVRGRKLGPVVRLSNRRIEHPLLGADGTVLAVVCDDHVEAERLGETPTTRVWREWEVELVDGTAEDLAGVTGRLLEAGARPSLYPSKLARALGGDLPARQVPPEPSPDMSTAELLIDRVGTHVAELVAADPQVRADADDAVHQMRVATRRLRSLLATFRPVLEGETSENLRDEMKWLAGALGEARDAEVLRDRLAALVAAEPPELLLGPVARRMDDELSVAYREAHDRVLVALDDARYFALLDSLEAWMRRPPVTDEAGRPAREVVPALLHRDWRRVRRCADAAQGAPDDAQTVLHDTRKAAKRLRYAAEGAVAVFGKRADRLARTAKHVQTVLGEHNDAVVARDVLRRLGAQAHLAGENGFSFGRLHALEQQRADASVRRFHRKWARVKAPKVRRWADG